jgi:hypothetical protein
MLAGTMDHGSCGHCVDWNDQRTGKQVLCCGSTSMSNALGSIPLGRCGTMMSYPTAPLSPKRLSRTLTATTTTSHIHDTRILTLIDHARTLSYPGVRTKDIVCTAGALVRSWLAIYHRSDSIEVRRTACQTLLEQLVTDHIEIKVSTGE